MKSFITVVWGKNIARPLFQNEYIQRCFLYYSMKTVGLGQRVLPDIKGTV